MVDDVIFGSPEKVQHTAEEVGYNHTHIKGNKKVDPTQHGINKGIMSAIKAVPMYLVMGAVFTVAIGAIGPFFAGGMAGGIGALGAEMVGSLMTTEAVGYLIGLPIAGAAIKGVMGFMKGQKEAEAHNAKLDGKAPTREHGRGRGHEVDTVGVASTPLLNNEPAYENAWHPAQEQRGSFAERVGGPRTQAESLAARIEAERAQRLSQQKQVGA